MKNNTFFNNTATYGGGLKIGNSNLILILENKFNFNRAMNDGGAI